MKTLSLHGTRIAVGGSIRSIAHYTPPDTQVVAISAASVTKHYASALQPFPVIEITDDEPHKTLETIAFITKRLLELGADRNTFLLGVGGGIVCDITGFAASVFMRGVKFGLVPTTLLAQVDAGIGGKTGVNFERSKNLLGTFYFPEFVLCASDVLNTLPQRTFTAGLAEVVKSAMIADADMFRYLECNTAAILQRKEEAVQRIISDAVRIKITIVEQDKQEHNVRRMLNMGHTFAHAIEKETSLPHGEAVSVGLCIAGKIACSMGLMSDTEFTRVERLLKSLQLPVRIDIAASALLPAILHDKKKDGNHIHFVLPSGIGSCEVRRMPLEELSLLVKKIECDEYR